MPNNWKYKYYKHGIAHKNITETNKEKEET